MATATQTSQSEVPPVLYARTRDVRTIASLLRPVHVAQICQVRVSEPGLHVITSMNGNFQASAYIGCALFDEYKYNPEEADLPDDDGDDVEEIPVSVFDVSLSTWLQCLNIYGTASGVSTSTSESKATSAMDPIRGESHRRLPFAKGKTVVELTYAGHGQPLVLQLNEGKVTTQCQISTYEADTLRTIEMPFSSERAVGQIIMPSKELCEALLSIDSSSQCVTFAFSNEPNEPPPRRSSTIEPSSSTLALSSAAGDDIAGRQYAAVSTNEYLRITANNDQGSTEMTFPNRNKVFESFAMTFPSQHTYHYTTLQYCFKAMQTSIKASIRIDDQGMMSLQCLFPDKPIDPAVAAMADENENGYDVQGAERRGFVEIRLASLTVGDGEES